MYVFLVQIVNVIFNFVKNNHRNLKFSPNTNFINTF